MNIAIDIDGTIIDTFGAVLKQFHSNFKYENLTKYWINEIIPGLTKERVIWEFEHLNQTHLSIIGENTLSTLEHLEWKNWFNDDLIYFLTDKTPSMMNWTQRFLWNNRIAIPIITSSKKQDYISKFDILIEDNPNVLEYGIPIEKLRFIKQPWNQCLEDKGIKRYNEISEIIAELDL